MPPFPSRTVFVANVPYDVSEEQLASVFSEVGPVQNVEIKFDQQTGRSKGYAFVLYYDDATALSAVRNLQDVPINGRNLRVEAASDDPGYRGGPRGGGGGGGGGGGRGPGAALGPGGYGRKDDTPPPLRSFSGAGMGERVDLGLLPPGQEAAMGQKATDAISQTLAAISPGKMQEVMAGMKDLIATQPDQARQLLASKPQLAYALFQAMLLLNLIDPAIAQRIQPVAPAPAPAPQQQQGYPPPQPGPGYPPFPPTQAPSSFPPYPPSAPAPAPQASGYRPPPPLQQQQQYGNAPPPPQQQYGGYPPAPAPAQPTAIPASAQAQLALLPQDQRDMLMQVLQLSPDQVNALDPGQKASVMQLRQQFLGAAA